MYLTPEIKKDIFKENGKSEFDCGTSECQVALFTYRIQHLTQHLRTNKKDLVTERSLVRLVSKRRRLLHFLEETEIQRYRDVIKKLKIRK